MATNTRQPGTSPQPGTQQPGLHGGPRPTPGTSADQPVPVDLERAYEPQMTGGNSPEDRAFGQAQSGSSQQRQGHSPRELGREIKDEARHTAERSYEQVRQFTNEAMDNARRQWEQSRGRFAHRISEVAEQQKEQVCKGMDDAVEAARAAAQVLEERNDPQVASWARWGAEGLEQTRNYLRGMEMDHIVDDVRQFTRRHPEWVLGGLFITGLAVARFLKADQVGSRHRPPRGADEGLWQDVVESQHGQPTHGTPGRQWDGGEYRAGAEWDTATGQSRQPGVGTTFPGTYDTEGGRATTEGRPAGSIPGAPVPGTTGASTGSPQRGDDIGDSQRTGGTL